MSPVMSMCPLLVYFLAFHTYEVKHVVSRTKLLIRLSCEFLHTARPPWASLLARVDSDHRRQPLESAFHTLLMLLPHSCSGGERLRCQVIPHRSDPDHLRNSPQRRVPCS
eukprot:COSAG06_NODE_6098_length_3113_cov_1.569343_2_plen_110_part_00